MFQWARILRYCVVLGLLALSWGAGVCSADDLFVGAFQSPGAGVYEYDGTTGAFIAVLPITDTFPLGGAIGSNGNLYVSNSNTDVVLEFNGTTTSTFASVDDAAGVVFGANGNLFVVSSNTNPPPGGQVITELNGATGTAITTAGTPNDPEGITRGPDGNIYVAGGDGKDVLEFNGSTGAFIKEFVTSGSGGLTSARGVAFGPDGNLFVASFGTNQILEYNGTTGAFIGSFADATGSCSGLSLPRDVTFGPNGNLFVSSYGSGDVFEFNGSSGACVSDFIPSGTGGLTGPTFLLFGDLGQPNGGGGSAVPEPSSLALIACGLAGVIILNRRKRARQLLA